MQEIGAKIIQLNFQLMWTSGLTPLFFFSSLGRNNFQTAIYWLRKMLEINSKLLEKIHIPGKFLLNQSNNNNKKFQTKYKKIKIFFLVFSIFSFSFDRSSSASECSSLCFDFKCPIEILLKIFYLWHPEVLF